MQQVIYLIILWKVKEKSKTNSFRLHLHSFRAYTANTKKFLRSIFITRGFVLNSRSCQTNMPLRAVVSVFCFFENEAPRRAVPQTGCWFVFWKRGCHSGQYEVAVDVGFKPLRKAKNRPKDLKISSRRDRKEMKVTLQLEQMLMKAWTRFGVIYKTVRYVLRSKFSVDWSLIEPDGLALSSS
jgi:hypothetical protein